MKTDNFQRLTEKTKSFSYVRTGPQELTFTFFDDYIDEVKANELGSIVAKERLFDESNLSKNLSELIRDSGVGFGRWGRNTVDMEALLKELGMLPL